MITDTNSVSSLFGSAGLGQTTNKAVAQGFSALLAQLTTTFNTHTSTAGLGADTQGSQGGVGACSGGGGGNHATSVTGKFSLQKPPNADLNGDGIVDLYDINQILNSYQTDAKGDVNGDGVTDDKDLAIALKQFGKA